MVPNTIPLNILIIDDDEIDTLAVKSCFSKLNVPIIYNAAKNGHEALEMLNSNKESKLDPLPQLIIVDTKMPKMNGIEFLRRLRANKKFDGISVFMLTGLYSTEDKLATRDLHVAGRVVKPLGQNDALHMYMTALRMPGFQV